MNDELTNRSPAVPVLTLKGVRRHYVQGKTIIDAPPSRPAVWTYCAASI